MLNVQSGFQRYVNHTRYKTHILKRFFMEYKEAMLMQAIGDKDGVMSEKISSLTDEKID